MLIQHYVSELAFPGWERSSCGGKSGPKSSCVSRELQRCLSLLLAKPLEKAFSQSIFAHVRVSCQKIFIFSVQKMDKRGRAQQINFQSRKARAPAVFPSLAAFFTGFSVCYQCAVEFQPLFHAWLYSRRKKRAFSSLCSI